MKLKFLYIKDNCQSTEEAAYIEWETIFASYTWNRRLVSRINKELKKTEHQENKRNPILKKGSQKKHK